MTCCFALGSRHFRGGAARLPLALARQTGVDHRSTVALYAIGALYAVRCAANVRRHGAGYPARPARASTHTVAYAAWKAIPDPAHRAAIGDAVLDERLHARRRAEVRELVHDLAHVVDRVQVR